ncbi:MAG TPA: hypothetical protein VIL72_07910, partial [Beijerinckiaceae bacterium]
DYERVIDGFAKKAVADSRLESADYYLTETVRALRSRHGVVAARAQPAALQRVFDAQEKMLAALSDVDPRLCVDFLHGRASQAFFDFAAGARPAVTELARAGLDAIVDGRDSRIQRAAPSDGDFAQLEAALVARGLTRAEIETLLDGKAAEPPLPDVAMCRAGRVYLQALKTLPEDVRLRIYALAVELLART